MINPHNPNKHRTRKADKQYPEKSNFQYRRELIEEKRSKKEWKERSEELEKIILKERGESEKKDIEHLQEINSFKDLLEKRGGENKNLKKKLEESEQQTSDLSSKVYDQKNLQKRNIKLRKKLLLKDYRVRIGEEKYLNFIDNLSIKEIKQKIESYEDLEMEMPVETTEEQIED